MIRVGVVGAGAHSSGNHGPALQRCREERPQEVELTAVCDLDVARAERYAGRFGFGKVYTDLETMVKEEALDGIVAVTPCELTEELAGRIAGWGKPLVIEKPPGETVEGARRLRDRVLAAGVPHMVSFNRRFSPALTRAREWLAGKPRPELAIARMLRHNRREAEFVFGTGIHLVDTVLALMGRPDQVVSQRYPAGEQQTMFFEARVTFQQGGAALLLLAPACGRVEESVELVGDDYDLQVDMGNCGVRIHASGKSVLCWQAPAAAEEWERNGTLDEMRAFIRCLETDQGWGPTLEDGCWSALTAAAIQAGGETRF